MFEELSSYRPERCPSLPRHSETLFYGILNQGTLITEWYDVQTGAKNIVQHLSVQDVRKKTGRFACCPVESGTLVWSSVIFISSKAMEKSPQYLRSSSVFQSNLIFLFNGHRHGKILMKVCLQLYNENVNEFELAMHCSNSNFI